MDVDQNRIQELVSRPGEGLNVEVKRWIDPDEDAGIAKIVRACLAIRNRNGGYVVFGFDNKTLQPDLAHQPPNTQAAFHLDKIQGIISRYSSEPFEIAVSFGQRDGQAYPVIVIPDGITTPIAAKADLSKDGKYLIRHGDVYFRTLRANGTPSTAVARPEDWPEIMQICFENRDADVGRFLRRQLAGQGVEALASALAQFASIANSPPQPTLQQRANAILKDGEERFGRALTSRTIQKEERILFVAGTFEIGLVIDPIRSDLDADEVFMSTVGSSNPALTGWPIWMDTRTFTDQNSWPVVKDDAREALVISIRGWSNHLDFMRLDPKGEFYLLRNIQDDVMDKIPPHSMLDPLLVLRRVTEALAVGLALAKGLGWAPTTTSLGFSFQWKKLKGRRLEPWSDPYSVVGGGTAQDDQIRTFVELSLDTPPTALAPLVDQATRRLFTLFYGAKIPMQVIEDIVRRVLHRS